MVFLLSFNYQSNSHWEVCVCHTAPDVFPLILINAARFSKELEVRLETLSPHHALWPTSVTPGTYVPPSRLCCTRALDYQPAWWNKREPFWSATALATGRLSLVKSQWLPSKGTSIRGSTVYRELERRETRVNTWPWNTQDCFLFFFFLSLFNSWFSASQIDYFPRLSEQKIKAILLFFTV